MKGCYNCQHWHFAQEAEEWQCWNDKSIHEGEARNNLQPACDKWEPEMEE